MTSFFLLFKECRAVHLMRTPERTIMSNCLNYANNIDILAEGRGYFKLKVSAPAFSLSAVPAFLQQVHPLFEERKGGLTNWRFGHYQSRFVVPCSTMRWKYPLGREMGHETSKGLPSKGVMRLVWTKKLLTCLSYEILFLKWWKPISLGILMNFRETGSPNSKMNEKSEQ